MYMKNIGSTPPPPPPPPRGEGVHGREAVALGWGFGCHVYHRRLIVPRSLGGINLGGRGREGSVPGRLTPFRYVLFQIFRGFYSGGYVRSECPRFGANKPVGGRSWASELPCYS